MTALSELAAFEALGRLVAGHGKSDWSAPSEPSIERLRLALSGDERAVSKLDLAVLLRQALRREYARREYANNPVMVVGHPRLRPFDAWETVGLDATAVAEGWRVTARAWRPSWLHHYTDHGVDDGATGEAVCRSFGAPDCLGDPFLATLNRSHYRSRGQRAAVRAALATPPGGTLVVALPTGEGKSLIFQLIHKVGFVGDDGTGDHGVTLVIVPTVALGVNHEEEAVTLCRLPRPLAYQGGAETNNAIIKQRIADGEQGLCFASPEAACGPLRPALGRAAEKGKLRAIVVDEAHLVDQWGTEFRTEFQELSGLQRELYRSAPQGAAPRTLLLSATLTDASRNTLRALFGKEREFASIAAVQLRPEPDYWVAKPGDNRVERVLQALHHVPRPAVLYVSTIKDAEMWHRELRNAGFHRLRMLHGKTSRQEREEIVAAWRDGAIDVVIGTSAFGLGIDYPHARSVIHACVPETLDRFYQEVGRGGRDGRTALSLIIPEPADLKIAEDINETRIITVKRGLKRWSTLFSGKKSRGGRRIAVRVDGSPGAGENDIDMRGVRNTDWNLRTLLLMARTGLIQLIGKPKPPITEPGDWLELELMDDSHLEVTTWDQLVEPERQAIYQANSRNLSFMKRFLEDRECPAEILLEMYSPERTVRSCSRCDQCRRDPAQRYTARSIPEPRAPWRLPSPSRLDELLGDDGRLLVTYLVDKIDRGESRRFGNTIERLQRMGLAKLIVLGESPFDMERIVRSVQDKAFFVSHTSSLARVQMPNGPEIVVVGADEQIGSASWAATAERQRILLVREDYRLPSGHLLREVHGGRMLTIEEFLIRVAE